MHSKTNTIKHLYIKNGFYFIPYFTIIDGQTNWYEHNNYYSYYSNCILDKEQTYNVLSFLKENNNKHYLNFTNYLAHLDI